MIKFLIYNEFQKIINRKRTYIGFILIGILIPFIVGAIDNGGNMLEKTIYGQLSDSFFFVGSLINGYLATYIIIAVLITHMPFLSTIVAADIVSGEYSKGTFRLYLSRPISRSKILLSKLIIVYGYTIILMGFFISYALLISTIWLGTGELAVFHMGLLFLAEEDALIRFFIAFLTSTVVMLTVSSLCFFISTISKNSVTPIIITISTVFVGTAISIIPIEFFERINPYLFTGYINSYLSAFHDPIPFDAILRLIIVCFIWTIIFLGLAFNHFIKKDITD
ncbi:MAG: ABC transporter permease [Candidatus Neomarinimicrobiota bacterium]